MAENLDGPATRDSIITYLRKRSARWHLMAGQATTVLVAERFAAAARLMDDAISDLEVEVDRMLEKVS